MVALIHFSCSLSFSGYDVPAASGSGLPSLPPRCAPRPEATEHSGNQRRSDQAGRLWLGADIQFSDGTYLGGEYLTSVSLSPLTPLNELTLHTKGCQKVPTELSTEIFK